MNQYKVKVELEFELPARSLKQATERGQKVADYLETVPHPNDSRDETWWPQTTVIISTLAELW
jgi:hypothetical protein